MISHLETLSSLFEIQQVHLLALWLNCVTAPHSELNEKILQITGSLLIGLGTEVPFQSSDHLQNSPFICATEEH